MYNTDGIYIIPQARCKDYNTRSRLSKKKSLCVQHYAGILLGGFIQIMKLNFMKIDENFLIEQSVEVANCNEDFKSAINLAPLINIL